MKHEVPIKIKVLHPLPAAAMKVQRGKDELLAPAIKSSEELVFEFEITVDLTDSQPNFLGKYSQGPRSDRFVYVNSGSYAGRHGSPWNRRAKISLMNITRDQIERAIEIGASLTTEFPGVGRDGGPTCASVKGIVWHVE